MLNRRFSPLIILLAAASFLGASKTVAKPDDDFARYIKEHTSTSYLIILASSRNFPSLKTEAQALSRKTHLPFSMQGLVFDPKRGLHLPDNDPDDVWAGSYYHRRYNDELEIHRKSVPFLSIEKSDYPGLKPGYYIIVAGIYDTRREANLAAARYRKYVPDVMIRKTQIYYGCLH